MELFEAQEIDVEAGAQGRNRGIVLGQVGIRCRRVRLRIGTIPCFSGTDCASHTCPFVSLSVLTCILAEGPSRPPSTLPS